MNTEIRKIVLIPRFTTYSGARTFLTPALNVRDVSYVELAAWRGTGVGASPTFEIQPQSSIDFENWANASGSFDPAGETHMELSLTTEWLRFAVTLGGTDPAFTCWAVGDFATRTSSAHGGAG